MRLARKVFTVPMLGAFHRNFTLSPWLPGAFERFPWLCDGLGNANQTLIFFSRAVLYLDTYTASIVVTVFVSPLGVGLFIICTCSSGRFMLVRFAQLFLHLCPFCYCLIAFDKQLQNVSSTKAAGYQPGK